MVAKNFLVMRKGKILSREYTKERAQITKRVLQKAGIKGLSVSKKSK